MNLERYSRQKEVLGSEGQDKLLNSRVLVIGTGGLGSSVLYYLTASGVGTIGIVDKDELEISNLNRQILHREKSLGKDKSQSAGRSLLEFNSELKLNIISEKLDKALAESLFPDYDIIINCVDNYNTRKIVSEIAVKFNKSVVEAGIEMMHGFVQIIIPGETACFNCFNLEEKEIKRQVLGAAAGMIGCMQSLECIKILTGKWDKSYSYISMDFNDYKTDRIFLSPAYYCCGCK